MITVYKYPLRCTGYAEPQEITLPWNSEILSVASQLINIDGEKQEKLFLWAKVDTEQTEVIIRTVIVVGTGQPIPEDIPSLALKPISTFFMSDDRSTGVGHAFELDLWYMGPKHA